MLPETSYLPFYWQSLCRNLSSVGSKSRSENSYLKTSSVCLPYGKIAPTSRKSITSSRDTINLICQLQYEFLVQKSAPEFLSSKTTHPHVNDWLILLLTDRPSRPFEFQADIGLWKCNLTRTTGETIWQQWKSIHAYSTWLLGPRYSSARNPGMDSSVIEVRLSCSGNTIS